MKKKLILYLSKLDHNCNIPIASTLAWISKTKGFLFDNYYDSYHQGVHFPGGDSRNLDEGKVTGGTVCGDRHFEEFYFLLHNFDVSVLSTGETIFSQIIKNLDIPIIGVSDRLSILYSQAFKYLDIPMPADIVMIGSDFGKALSGLESYLYPEIYYRQAIGVNDSISDDELADLYQEGGKVYCIYVDEGVINKLVKARRYDVEVIDRLKPSDDYLSITERIALRWKDKVNGWILGDPTLVAHWLPTACEEGLIALYSIPQEKIVTQLVDLISSKGRVIYGRQYSDRDFFELSKLDQCLQVIDPCRPPFQSVKHVGYDWDTNQGKEGFYAPEYSDEELRQFAREGRILVSLMFWSGMIREIANFYNLFDLFAMTKLKCGLILTAQSYEYMMHSPVELLTVPIQQGGVYPLVEPVLGSCGIGVGIESFIAKQRLEEDLREGLLRIRQKVKKENYMPRGWWATMDTDLEKLSWWNRPAPFRFLRYSPYLQIRFHAKDKKYNEDMHPRKDGASEFKESHYIDKIKSFIQRSGLMKYFESYRPYEFYKAGQIKKDIIDTAESVGFQYMFSKAGFNPKSEIKHVDENFIALNYTSGQWDGWTPFETINDVTDLKKSEHTLLQRNKPGWIVSTIDSCLWTFSGEFWKRGNKLYEIAEFCAQGGDSQKLVNVKPYTIARYARIIDGIKQ
jgi:hypothetical protein